MTAKSEPMAQYPRLRDKVEQLCHNFLAECERAGKTQVELMFSYEMAFVNTVHPECGTECSCVEKSLCTNECVLTCRFSASANSQKAKLLNRGDSLQAALGQKSGSSQAPDTLIRSGQLTVLPDKKRMLGKKMVFGKEYFFKLTLTTLSYFKSEDEANLKFTFKTEGLKLIEKDPLTFIIVDPTNTLKISKGESPDQLVVKCGNKEETQAWQAALLRAGVYPIKQKKAAEDDIEDDGSSLDPLLERQVDSIRNLVDQ